MTLDVLSLTQTNLSQAIVRFPLVVSSDTPLLTVTTLMAELRSPERPAQPEDVLLQFHQEVRASCVIVMERDRIVGLITEQDVVRLMAQQQDPTDAIATVMTHPVQTLRESALTDIFTLLSYLHQHHIRHLPVVDNQDRLVGMITHDSLVYALRPCELYSLAKTLQTQVTAGVAALDMKSTQERLILEIATQIRNSLDLQTILDTTVTQVRQVLNCDRVILYQFDADWRGQVVAESLHHGRSLLHTEVTDPCITPEWLEPYRQGRVRVVPDIHAVAMSQCHQDMLLSFDIRAKAMVPIVVEERLWGLMIASHRDQPRDWQPMEIELLQTLALHVAIALKQATIHQQLHIELAERQRSEIALAQSEQRFRAIFNNMFQFIGLLTPDGTVLEANQTALTAAGITVEAVMGKPFWDCPWWQISPQVQADLKAAIARAAQGEFIRYEVDVWGAGQTVLPIDFSLRPVRDATGQVVLLIPEGRDLTDVRKRDRALAASETRFQKLVDTQPGTLYIGIQQPNGGRQFTYLSATWSDLFDLSIEATLADASLTFDLIHPDDRSQVEANIAHSVATLTPLCQEFRVITPQGRLKWIQERSRPERLPNGAVQWFAVALDVSDRKQAEQALQASEQRFRAMFEQAAVGIGQVNTQGQFIEVNQYFCQLLGYSQDEFLTHTFIDITHPDDIAQDMALSSQLYQGMRDAFQMEKRYRHREGHWIWTEVTVSVLKDEAGQPMGNLAVVVDIRDRKQAEDLAQKMQATLLDAQEIAHIGNWAFDLDSQTITWSPELYRMFGLDPAQPLPHYADLLSMLHPADRALLQQHIAEAIAHGTPYILDYRVILPDGSLRYHEGRGAAERDGQGHIIGLIGTALDITCRKQTEQALRQVNDRLKGILTACPDLIFYLSADGQYLDIYADDYDDLWQTPEQLLNRRIRDVLPVSIAQIFETAIQQTLSTHSLITLEYSLPLEQGETYFEARFAPLGDDSVVVVARNISDRKQAEQALQASEARFRAIFEQAAVGINQADRDGYFVEANRYFCDLYQVRIISLYNNRNTRRGSTAMGRRLHLACHLSTDDLEQRYKSAKDGVERGHYQVIWLLQRGKSTAEVCEVTGYSRGWIYDVVRSYNQDGPAALGDQRRHNQGHGHVLLTDEMQAQLCQALQEPPPEGGQWNGRKVADWLSERLGRPVHRQRGWEILKQLEFSLRVPRPEHEHAATEDEQRAWEKKSAPSPSGDPRRPSRRRRSTVGHGRTSSGTSSRSASGVV
jgi:PAS domain S-box-containing protein